jgi:hypothetical protein
MKKIFIALLFVALFLFSNETSAQKLTPQQQKSLHTMYKNRKVVYFKFKVNSVQEIKGMSNIVSVDKVKGTEVMAHATQAQFTRFLPYNYKYTIVPGGPPKKKPPVKKVVKK